MLKLRQGAKVPFPEQLKEGYEQIEGRLIGNLSEEKVLPLMRDFLSLHEGEHLFFILEIPCTLDQQRAIAEKAGETAGLYKNVYYLDGCTPEQARDILEEVGQLALNDGMCSFGFGGHEAGDEVVFGAYNVLSVYGKQLDRLRKLLEQYGLSRVRNLVTAWDTFSREHHGECSTVETGGKRVYDIPELLADRGIYLAEQRES